MIIRDRGEPVRIDRGRQASRVWRVGCLALALAVVCLVSCTGLPPPHPYTYLGYARKNYKPTDTIVQPASSANGLTRGPRVEGREFCRDVAIRARKRAAEKAQGAIALYLVTGAALAGAVTSAETTSKDADASRHVPTFSLFTTAAVTGVLASAVLWGQGDTAELAAIATESQNSKDAEANRACNSAMAAWQRGESPAAEPTGAGSPAAEPAASASGSSAPSSSAAPPNLAPAGTQPSGT